MISPADRRRAEQSVRRDYRLARRTARFVRAATKTERSLVLAAVPGTVDGIAGRVPWGQVAQAHADALEALWDAVGHAVYDAEVERLVGVGVKALPDWLGPDAGRFVDVIAGKGRRIAATARRRLVDTIERGKVETARQATRRIQSLYRTRLSSTAIGRAAIRETLQASATMQHHAALEASRRTGRPLVHQWVTVGDGRVRDAHAAAEGQTRLITLPFRVGGELLNHPRDPTGSPSNVIGCRCFESTFLDPTFRPNRS